MSLCPALPRLDRDLVQLSRIREEYLRTGDTSESVASGLAKTARVITAAAAIMVVVFLAFVFSNEVFLKLMGLGMATAILVDATIVRMLFMPAAMQLLGRANWWIPSWLDRGTWYRARVKLERESRHHRAPAAGAQFANHCGASHLTI